MKACIYTLAAIAVLCGCQQKADPRDAQIKALQDRLTELEGWQERATSIMTNMVGTLKGMEGGLALLGEAGPMLTNMANEVRDMPSRMDYSVLALRIGYQEQLMWQTHPDAVRRFTNSLAHRHSP